MVMWFTDDLHVRMQGTQIMFLLSDGKLRSWDFYGQIRKNHQVEITFQYYSKYFS